MLTTAIQNVVSGIAVTIESEFDASVDGWLEAREDLGLNGPEDEGHPRFNVLEEVPKDRPKKVTLVFGDDDDISMVKDELYENANDRFKAGMTSEAEDVKRFANALPTSYQVENL